MSEKGDSVVFEGVSRSVPPGQKLAVTYQCAPGLTRNSRDWVGLFRVGWTSSRDYYTFEWAPQPPAGNNNGIGSVTFAARRLPPEDGHFYQLCYVSPNGTVRGASAPIQFSAAAGATGGLASSIFGPGLEELEVVEVREEGSLMVVRPRQEEQQKTTTEQLQQQLQVKREAEAHLVEKLEAERAASSELTAALASEKAAAAELKAALASEKAAAAELKATLASEKAAAAELRQSREEEEVQRAVALTEELRGEKERSKQLKQSLEAECATLLDVRQQGKAERGRSATLREELEVRQGELAEASAELHDLKQQLALKETQVCDLEQLVAVSRANQCSQDELAAQRAKELEQLQQELSVAQENIAELMGVARQQQAPPHPSPPQQADSVERSVYDALLQAYDNMEQYYREATRVRSEVEQQNALLVARVEQCRQEYQARSRELAELMRSKGGEGEGLRELEEMNRTCERAAQELSMRQEQVKGHEARILELETELSDVQREFEAFQEKHDSRMAEKSEALEVQQRLLRAREEELALLKARLRRGAAAGQRHCPVCGVKFPTSTEQATFEEHVQAHFQD